MKQYKIGFLGVGKMGGSILNGIVSSLLYQKDDICLFDKNPDVLDFYKALGYNFASNEVNLFESCNIVILAIKPQMFDVLELIVKNKKFNCLIVSIAAGISISMIKNIFGPLKCIRVMPNTPALIGKATSVISRDDVVLDDEFNIVKNIFEKIGVVVELSEIQMNEIIPLNGSMPAYLYYFAEGFIENGIKNGINEEVCKQLVANAIIGSAEMILKANKPTSVLIEDVCSPGGTTLAGLYVLEENGLKKTIDAAADACIKRAYELANRK